MKIRIHSLEPVVFNASAVSLLYKRSMHASEPNSDGRRYGKMYRKTNTNEYRMLTEKTAIICRTITKINTPVSMIFVVGFKCSTPLNASNPIYRYSHSSSRERSRLASAVRPALVHDTAVSSTKIKGKITNSFECFYLFLKIPIIPLAMSSTISCISHINTATMNGSNSSNRLINPLAGCAR